MQSGQQCLPGEFGNLEPSCSRVLAFCARFGLLSLALLSLDAQTPTRSPARNPIPSLQSLSQSFEDLVDRISRSVVRISTVGLEPVEEGKVARVETDEGVGSGVIVDSNGYIVTNAHVIGSARTTYVLLPLATQEAVKYRSILAPPGKRARARIVGIDRETDIAVLKIDEKDLPALSFGDSANMRKGTLVFAAGSPFGLENSVSMGIVSSVARQLQPDDPMIYVQTDAPINPGNSGGPLVNADGNIVGINTFIVSKSGGNEGIGFAVPSHIARTVYQQIREQGRVRRGQIGVIAQTITPELASGLGLPRNWGVILADVAPSSPAAAGGLEIKDIILSLDGLPVENARQFGVHIYPKAGQTVSIELLRKGERFVKQVAVAERPRDPERLISLANPEDNAVTPLGILALDLNEKVTPLLPDLRRLSGAVVAGVTSSTSLQAADVIYEVNNQKISGLADLKSTTGSLKHGDSAVLQIERAGQLQFIAVEIQ